MVGLCVGSWAGWRGAARKELVEVFDIEPVGGPQKASEGYIWVGECDVPQSGKKYAPTDEKTPAEEQKKRIRN